MNQEMFGKFIPEVLNAPYTGEEVSEIRGITLPRDYMDFMRLHNGGSFMNPDDKEERLVLFCLEGIQKGDCYLDGDGFLLGSAALRTHSSLFIRESARCLYGAFYDDHIVLGYYRQPKCEDCPLLLVVDRQGRYRIVLQKQILMMPSIRFEAGEKVVCLFDTPMGLLEIGEPPQDYRIVQRSVIQAYTAKYGQGSEGPHRFALPVWPYMTMASGEKSRQVWSGQSMKMLFEFLNSDNLCEGY